MSAVKKFTRDELISIIADMRRTASKVFRDGEDPEECIDVLWSLNRRMFEIEINARTYPSYMKSP